MTTLLRLGTRGSALALWQANHVAGLLRARDPAVEVDIVVLKTTGDVRQDIPLPEMAGKGVFVREIESALLHDAIDIAVHSAKDLQSADPPGLMLAAFCERADPRDALVSPQYGTLAALPHGARVATGSPRRVAQLHQVRPDLTFVEIRGNVDTRLAKLTRGDADALILAVAGLERLGRAEVISERIPKDVCLPQVGQACVAVQCREADEATRSLVAAACDHEPTRFCVQAERAFLSRLGGGCTAPVAAHASALSDDNGCLLEVFVASSDGGRVFRAQRPMGKEFASAVNELYDEMLRYGASEGGVPLW